MKKSIIDKELRALFRQLQKAQEKARSLGIFIDDRELLECPECGLCEDITFQGFLFTHHKDDIFQENPRDIQFRQIDDDHFECPVCETTVTVPPEAEYEDI
jgi:rubredoxin